MYDRVEELGRKRGKLRDFHPVPAYFLFREMPSPVRWDKKW